jgi:hypothetical protein
MITGPGCEYAYIAREGRSRPKLTKRTMNNLGTMDCVTDRAVLTKLRAISFPLVLEQARMS